LCDLILHAAGTDESGSFCFKILASVCDEIWAIDGSGQLLKHSQQTLNFKEKEKQRKHSKTELDPEDKDWELVESL
jgi:hypothetical protein